MTYVPAVRAALLCAASISIFVSDGAVAQDAPKAATVQPSAEPTIITPERLLRDYAETSTKYPAPQWLPDTDSLIITVMRRDSAGKSGLPYIERVEAASGKRTLLVQGSNPKVSPDGSALAFLSGEGAGRHLLVYDIASGKTKQLAALPTGTAGFDLSFAWSPDSRRIAYGYRPARAPKTAGEDASASSVLVVGAPGDTPLDSEIWTVDVASAAARKIASEPAILADAGWLADGKHLIFTAVGSFEYRSDNVAGKIIRVSVETGDKSDLVTGGGVQNLRPVVSPDGRNVAFTYDPGNLVYPFFWNIALVPSSGGAVQQLTKDLFVASGPVWSRDGKTIFFACKSAVFSQICSVGATGAVKQLTRGPRSISSITVSPRGDRLLWSSEDATGRVEVRTSRLDGADEKVLVDLNPELDRLALGEVSEIAWKSRDGLRIPGLLIKPLHYDPSRRYPLIVDIHGGPVGGVILRGGIVKTTPLEWQMWAAKGYAVLVPDYRASTVAGWAPVLKTREDQDYDMRDMDDVMSGVDHVIGLGIADPDKLAVIGHSAGAILTNWIVTHSNRFKAAISYEGWVDMYHAYGSGMRVGGNAIAEWMYKGKPWETPENYRNNSASEFVKGVTIPTMFVSGDYSGQSGVENLYHNEFMYSAWKKQNVDTQLLIYRGEGHVIQKPENVKDFLTRAIAWIDARISSPRPSE